MRCQTRRLWRLRNSRLGSSDAQTNRTSPQLLIPPPGRRRLAATRLPDHLSIELTWRHVGSSGMTVVKLSR
eukprot:3353074-Pyramimonas_sp.AAC.1